MLSFLTLQSAEKKHLLILCGTEAQQAFLLPFVRESSSLQLFNADSKHLKASFCIRC